MLVQQHGGHAVVQPVGARQGGSAGDGDTGLVAGELAREFLNACNRHAGARGDAIGCKSVERVQPANGVDNVEPVVGRRQSLGGDDLGDGQRQGALLPGVDVHP